MLIIQDGVKCERSFKKLRIKHALLPRFEKPTVRRGNECWICECAVCRGLSSYCWDGLWWPMKFVCWWRGVLCWQERGQTLEDPTHCPEFTTGRRALQTFQMKLQLYGQALLCCIFVVSCLWQAGVWENRKQLSTKKESTKEGEKTRFLQNLKSIIQVSKGMLLRRCSRK